MSGFSPWLIQRISALWLALFLPWLVLHFIFDPPTNHLALQAWLADTPVAVALLFGLYALLAHGWVGMRDIFLDYVHPPAIRLTVLALTASGLLACGIWGTLLILAVRGGA